MKQYASYAGMLTLLRQTEARRYNMNLHEFVREDAKKRATIIRSAIPRKVLNKYDTAPKRDNHVE